MRSVALASICLVLCACVGGGALVVPSLPPGAPRVVELTDTPFHPQSEFQCGPAALATVLGASGVRTSADELQPLVYLPARRGSLQVEMQSAPRKFGRLSFELEPEFDAILAELAAQRPVLVLHNYGLPFLPRWHYAVVVGYDADADRVVMRSGTTARQLLSARTFMRAWDNGDRWALVMLKPGELPASTNVNRYLESAAAFERGASPADTQAAFEAAVQRWPDQPIAWIGLGTAQYRRQAFESAARDYAKAVALDTRSAGARNNLAMTLVELGCPAQAREQLAGIDRAALNGPLREAVLDTEQRLTQSRLADPVPAVCAEIGSSN
jgi:tetratricopeptide (TPR) repeat protein